MRPRTNKLVTLVAAIFIPVMAWGGSSEVTASRLNVRSGPSTGYRVLGSVARGTVLETLGPKSGSWIKVRYNNRDAWVHGNYMKTVATNNTTTTSSTQTSYVTAGSLNVRSGPSTRYRRIGSLSRGTAVEVLSSSGSWRKVKLQSGTGWVHGKYLSSSKPSSTTPTSSSSTPSRKGYIQLSNSGPGYFGYYSANRRWGTPTFIYGIQRVARRFKTANPSAPRLGVGDISYMNGGKMSGHASHQKGVDGDFRPLKNNGTEGRVTIFQSTYSRSLSQKMFDLFDQELRIKYIFFNDKNTRHTTPWPNHDNHFHVRIY
ncbi:MAG: penicillin-insensitive murein endopeptidase [Planctomycetota bacterium]|nr:penicillin-insensitive murein endopeptidase [Planctomycetota bacterium]